MKISKSKGSPEKIKMRTKSPTDMSGSGALAEWWLQEDKQKKAMELCSTAAWLKTQQTYRMRQLACDVRLYSGLSIYSYAGSNVSKMDRTKALPDDRPTFNVISSCVDTLVSRISQAKPEPKFLTDGADYKQRHLAQQLNKFIIGEFYQTKAYEKGTKMFRDMLVMGSGALKVYEGDDKKVAVDRVLITDLFTDDNDSLNGTPQTLYQLKLMDKEKLMSLHPKKEELIAGTPQAYPDNSPDSGRSTANQVMVVEGWKLASGSDPDAEGYYPGSHTIATVNGLIDDDADWQKTRFPFVIPTYDDPFIGFWGRGIATRQFGTQLTLNRILYTIARAITLVGVPRVFIEQNSKVVKSHMNNELGVISTYTGTKPSYEVAPCNAPEMYEERDKLIQYAFQSEGVSSMQATSQKPAGLNSGEAIRTADDINNDRFALTAEKHKQIYIDIAYLITDTAMDIAKREGKYQTVYPNKDGTKEIDLPAMKFLKDPFVIQCFDESSLPRTPAGRIEKITEMVQSGMITLKEGRRLMRTQDLEQNEKLDNASEERIFKYLDDIVEKGKYTPPDAFMDLNLAIELSVKYYNLYVASKLEQDKADQLVDFYNQCLTLQAAAQPPPMPMQGAPAPTANPQPNATSPLVPNTNAAPPGAA